MENAKEFISTLRYDFSKSELNESEIYENPLVQFEHWFKEAVDNKVLCPNAMTLATCGTGGRPSARIMLLRDFNEKGFVFYTNYHSRKSSDIEHTPYAALIFFWPELERQIRIEGELRKQSETESDVYFSIRPRGSKLGAWSSQQSQAVESRKELEEALANKKYNALPSGVVII
jgi:pyridoxamine 5'-phosphate oxidase